MVDQPQRPSSLAFICQPYHRGGVTRWMVEAAAEWRRRGCDSWFVVPRPRRPFPSGAGRPLVTELIDALPRDRQPTRVEPAVGYEFELGTSAYRADVYARATLDGVPAGVPVIVSDDAAAWEAGATLAGRNPFVGVLHADDVWYYNLAEQYRASVSALVGVSERVARRTREIVGRGDPRPVVTIPCGIPIPANARTVGGAGEADARARLLWMGRIDERQKRVSDLARIAEVLARDGVRFQLDIVGDGYDTSLIQQGLSATTLPHVFFHGWLPQAAVTRMLAAADVLLLPSNFEGMPLAGMEALAHGCGVVASSRSGLEEYQQRPSARGCLWIHAVGDVEAAARAVREALSLQPVARSLSARCFATEEFAIATCMDRYDRILGELTLSRPSPTVRRRSGLVTSLVARSLATVRQGRRWLARHRREGSV